MIPNWEKLTPKQQDAAKKLQREISKRGFVFGIKQAVLLFVMNIANVVVNAVTVKNNDFVFFMSIASAILVMSNVFQWPKSQHDYIAAEVKKILDDK